MKKLFLLLLISIFLITLSNCKKNEEPENTKVENCTNGIDDDGDGFIDAENSDCAGTGEICNNGIDDDLDGLIACDDPDCDGDPYC